ncbi:MAG: DUF2093 domain-containing protein [Nitratireductor sp.]
MSDLLVANGTEAKLIYLDSDYDVEKSGTYVRCAITDQPITLDDLKYWSVERQEAYIDGKASLEAELKAKK